MKTGKIRTAILAAICCAVLAPATAFAEDATADAPTAIRERNRERIHVSDPDQVGDRIDARLDRQGDRIEQRLDRNADRARAAGRDRLANRLEDRGERINRRLDRQGDRINARLNRARNRSAARAASRQAVRRRARIHR